MWLAQSLRSKFALLNTINPDLNFGQSLQIWGLFSRAVIAIALSATWLEKQPAPKAAETIDSTLHSAAAATLHGAFEDCSYWLSIEGSKGKQNAPQSRLYCDAFSFHKCKIVKQETRVQKIQTSFWSTFPIYKSFNTEYLGVEKKIPSWANSTRKLA